MHLLRGFCEAGEWNAYGIESQSARGGEGSYWWTLLAPKVKNIDHARHKEEQMVLLGVSFPLQDLALCSFTSYQSVTEMMQ